MSTTENSSEKNTAVLLAAGGGTRMKAKKPKTLIKLKGKPIVSYAVRAIAGLNEGLNMGAGNHQNIGEPQNIGELIAVVGVRHNQVSRAILKAAKTQKETSKELKISFAHQPTQLGTGDAVKKALEILEASEPQGTGHERCILVLPADAPLITTKTLAALLTEHHESQNVATLLTAEVPNPEGYGRVIRDENGNLKKIVEHTDATQNELLVNEVCTSIYCFQRGHLADALKKIQPAETSGEYYLTDVVRILVESKNEVGAKVGAFLTPDFLETLGINTPDQLEKITELAGKNPKNDHPST